MSSVHNKFIPSAEAIPLLENNGRFNTTPDALFAVGNIGHGPKGYEGSEDVFDAYLRLRANVYVDQTRMLEPSVKQPDGTERDNDDERSEHFAVLENRLARTAIVACLRLIHKRDEADHLPIEHYFPEAFEDQPAAVNSLEVSRFIVRNGNEDLSNQARTALLTSGLAYTRQNKLGPAYAVVEPDLEDHLLRMGIPLERIGGPKDLAEYNDVNVGIKIDSEEMARRFGKGVVARSLLQPNGYRYWGTTDVSEEVA